MLLVTDRDSVSQIVGSLSSLTQRSEAAVMSTSLFRIDETEKNYRINLKRTFDSMRLNDGGEFCAFRCVGTFSYYFNFWLSEERFLVVSSNPHIVMEEAQKYGLSDTGNQWLFFILKNSSSKYGTLPIMKYINEGSNVAVAINTTVQTARCMVLFFSMRREVIDFFFFESFVRSQA